MQATYATLSLLLIKSPVLLQITVNIIRFDFNLQKKYNFVITYSLNFLFLIGDIMAGRVAIGVGARPPFEFRKTSFMCTECKKWRIVNPREARDIENVTRYLGFTCRFLINGDTCATPALISGRALDILYGDACPKINETWAKCEKHGCGKWRYIAPSHHDVIDFDRQFACDNIKLSCAREQVVPSPLIDYVLMGKAPQKPCGLQERLRKTKFDVIDLYYARLHQYLSLFIGEGYDLDRREKSETSSSLEESMKQAGITTWQAKADRMQELIDNLRNPRGVQDESAEAAAGPAKRPCTIQKITLRLPPRPPSPLVMRRGPPPHTSRHRDHHRKRKLHPELDHDRFLPLKKRCYMRGMQGQSTL